MAVIIDEVHAEVMDDRPPTNGTGQSYRAPKTPPPEEEREERYREWQWMARRAARLQEW